MSSSRDEAREKWGSLNFYNDDIRSMAVSNVEALRDLLKYGYIDEHARVIQEEDCCDDSIYINGLDDRYNTFT